MSFFKTQEQRRKASGPAPLTRQETLRQQRVAREDAQKAAGVWGEMSVGVITGGDGVFIHHWKGRAPAGLYEIVAKKPREMSIAEHQALAAWLKAGRYDGFVQSFAAWDVSEDEAERIKKELIDKHRAEGKTIVNPPL